MIGRTLGHYQILEPLGAGGMGEVYRARDTKLDRDVAIKVLPEDFADDQERLARFEREAKVLASLNHANIAVIYGLEEADGVRFIAMECVEGATLAEMLATAGRIEVDDALEIGRQIAEALEVAHESGVVHRDLKPANVKVTPEGKVKVLDFGLAKAYETDGSPSEISPDLSQSPTVAVATRTGVILGTAAYMSPEQARGKPVDKRTDIWAFGCVLYEMLTGRRVFEGETVSDTMAAILKEEPNWGAVPAPIPAELRWLLRLCLAKEARQRLRDVGEARLLIGEILTGVSALQREEGYASPPRGVSWNLAAPAAAMLVLLGAAITWVATGQSTPPPGSVAAHNWPQRPLTQTGDAWNVALSPDGRTVAYLTSEGLVTQDVAGGSPVLALPDPVWGAHRHEYGRWGFPNGEPQWLADGSGVAFAVSINERTWSVSAVPRMAGDRTGKLVTEFTGGEPAAAFQSLPGDTFLVARVLENEGAKPWIRWFVGGESEQEIDVPEEFTDLWDAVASPDGRWVAYIAERVDRTNVLATMSRDGSQHHVIAERGAELSKWHEIATAPKWAINRIMRWPVGAHVYYRQHSTRGVDLYASRIDPDSGEGIGDPELVVSGLPPGATFDVAQGGNRIVYSGGPIRTQIRLFRFDARRGGEPIEDRAITSGTARHIAPRISPNGHRIAYVRETAGSEDIYIVPRDGGEARRVDVLNYRWDQVVDLKWSPNGDELAVFAVTGEGTKLVRVPLSAGEPARELETQPVRGTWFDWSHDGSRIVYGISSDEFLVIHDLETGEEEIIAGERRGEKIHELFSPDDTKLLIQNIDLTNLGLWIHTIDTGESRLVTPDVLVAGATGPVHWSRDGVIYLLNAEGTILTVDESGGAPREFARLPEPPTREGWASMSVEGDYIYLACAIDEPRESDVWVLERPDSGGAR